MKKRWISLLLVIALFCGMLPAFAAPVSALDQLTYAPYANVEYGYTEEVEVGTIRYIRQTVGGTHFNWNYWPANSFGAYYGPGSECGTACISMALSYVGINKTPKDILNAHQGETWFTGWGADYLQPTISEGMNNYINGNGKYSPVIIHLNYGQSKEEKDPGHFVMIVGKVSDNVWQIMDPATDALINYTINGNSINYMGVANTIDSVRQYYNVNAAPIITCITERYNCYLEVTTPESSKLWNMPCSDKTSDDAQVLDWTTAGGRYVADMIYKNTEDNYWYRVQKDGKVCYLYSGNTSSAERLDPGVTVSGLVAPQNIKPGSIFNIEGHISSPKLPFNDVSAYIYQGSQATGESYTHSTETVEKATSYDIKSGAVNKNLKFDELPEGTYTYVLRILVFRYSASGNRISVFPEFITLAEQVFTVGDSSPTPPSTPSQEIYQGIDVSHHQGTINWDTVAPNIDFAIIRCGYGDDMSSQDDKQWRANADACTRLGIPFGVYIYSYALSDAQARSEANHVLRLIQGYDPDLPIYLDLEDASILNNCSKADILRHAQIFCDIIEGAGYEAGIYANYNWWTNYLTDSAYDQWSRWIARYASATGYNKSYDMWQYTDKGSVPGISGSVDMDYWYGALPGAEGPYFQVSGVDFPSAIVQGTNPTVTGSVSSNDTITWVWTGVDPRGIWNHLIQADYNPLTTYYDLTDLIAQLDFASLAPGEYTFKIEGISGGQYFVAYEKDFTVTATPSDPVDIGTDFYAMILNTAAWKPIGVDEDGWVHLENEVGDAHQLWKFVRQDNGSYSICSAETGKLLGMHQGDITPGNPVDAVDDDWGGAYQHWFIYRYGDGYVLHSTHFMDKNLVLDLYENNTTDGATIATYTRNNSTAQIWTIYTGSEILITSPTLTVETGSASSSTKFEWNDVRGESRYDLRIWKDEWTGNAYYAQSLRDTTCFELQLPAGTYYAMVSAANHFVSKNSTLIKFTVSGGSQVSVTFDGNGGAGIDTVLSGAPGESIQIPLEIPERFGWNFLGWSTNPNASAESYWPGEVISVERDTVLYAIWAPATVINSNLTAESYSVNIRFPYDYHIYSFTPSIDANYRFQDLGSSDSIFWLLDENNQSIESSDDANQTQQADLWYYLDPGTTYYIRVNLYNDNIGEIRPQFRRVYEVGYHADGADPASIPEVDWVCAGDAYQISSTVPVRDGYSFLGWSAQRNATSATYRPGQQISVRDDMLLFAVWKTAEENPFTDVPAGSFYYDPVLWAVKNGITNGATATTFNPDGQCLRAHVVTFLHRAAGSPAPASSSNPFSDVKTSDFFYKPVLWAVEEGITNGISANAFGSYDVCNRAAVVTFLWRAAGSPEPQSTSHPFVDVKNTDFFYKPVLWAAENGITSGIDATHFSPGSPCNRAQVVTFLYRAYN